MLVNKPLLAHHLEGVVNGVEVGLRCAMRLEATVCPGKVLAVVDGEVKVVQGVVRGAVDVVLEPVAGDHVAIMDEDGPYLNEDEHGHVEVLLHGEDEDECAKTCQ